MHHAHSAAAATTHTLPANTGTRAGAGVTLLMLPAITKVRWEVMEGGGSTTLSYDTGNLGKVCGYSDAPRGERRALKLLSPR